VYRFKVRGLKVKLNKNQDGMLTGVAEIDEPKDSKKTQYNRHTTFFQMNITRQGAPWLNQFLYAFARGKKSVVKSFWADGPLLESDKLPAAIKAIGPMKVKQDGFWLYGVLGHRTYKGEPQTEVTSWITKEEVVESEEDGDWEETEVEVGAEVDDDGDNIEPEVDGDDEPVWDSGEDIPTGYEGDEESSGGPRDDIEESVVTDEDLDGAPEDKNPPF
jgi:hypothetical protein